MTEALAPTLTRLDRKVLDVIGRGPRRLPRVHADVRGRGPWVAAWRDVTVDDVHGILRGLEHLGLATRTRNGWWKAAR